MSRLISLALQKGGVGKTTCAINLAGALAGHYGLNTLLLDFDGQTNATTTLLGRHYAAAATCGRCSTPASPSSR
jgi:chromosome partitioning protein